MNTLFIFIWIFLAMIATSFWEAYSEGRNSWDKNKLGFKIKIGKKYVFSAYHFFLFFVMWPILLTLPLVTTGWDMRLFGVLLSAYFAGLILEDFFWYVVNPKVKLKELWSDFSDYYPWIRISGKKIIPLGYVVYILISLASWLLIWK